MARDGLSGFKEGSIAAAVTRLKGLAPVRRRRRFVRSADRGKPSVVEQRMTEHPFAGGSSKPPDARTYQSDIMGLIGGDSSVETTQLPSFDPISGLSPGEAEQAVKAMTERLEKIREKATEATADYLAKRLADPLFEAATKSLKTGSFPETKALDGIDVATGLAQGAVNTPLKDVSGAVGLSPSGADFTAGVTTNLILAPMTGPLGEAATYIEIAGIIIGLATGAHPLVLACIKPLAHSQLEHALSQCIVNLIPGSHTDEPQSGTHTPTMRDLLEQSLALAPPPSPGSLPPTHPVEAGQHPTPDDAPDTRREAVPNEPPWICLGFVPKHLSVAMLLLVVSAAVASRSRM